MVDEWMDVDEAEALAGAITEAVEHGRDTRAHRSRIEVKRTVVVLREEWETDHDEG